METADERLKALSELPGDWDDEGALPICPLVLQHTKSLIDAANFSIAEILELIKMVNID